MSLVQQRDLGHHQEMAAQFHFQADKMLEMGDEESALWNRVEALEHEDRIKELS